MNESYDIRCFLPNVTLTTEDMWPATIYTADGNTSTQRVQTPSIRSIRPEITTILDVVTHEVVSMALSRSANVIAVTEALRNSYVQHGTPVIFYVN